jgi:hypothetical protein
MEVASVSFAGVERRQHLVFVTKNGEYHAAMAAAAPFEMRHLCGRLVLSRLRVMGSVADVTALAAEMARMARSITDRIVIFADYREAVVFNQPTADAFLAMLGAFNPRIERSGLLLAADRATFNLQVERLVREAGHASRRAFRARTELVGWLGEVLTAPERASLDEIVGR